MHASLHVNVPYSNFPIGLQNSDWNPSLLVSVVSVILPIQKSLLTTLVWEWILAALGKAQPSGKQNQGENNTWFLWRLGYRDNKHDTGIEVSQILAVCLENHVMFPSLLSLLRCACATSHVIRGGYSLISAWDAIDQCVFGRHGLFFIKWRCSVFSKRPRVLFLLTSAKSPGVELLNFRC